MHQACVPSSVTFNPWYALKRSRSLLTEASLPFCSMSQPVSDDYDLQRLRDDVSFVKMKLSSIAGHCAQNHLEIAKIEKHIKDNVESSLLEWRTCLDQRHTAWQQTAEKHLLVVEKEVARVSASMLSEIAIVRQNGTEAVSNMMQLVADENLKLTCRGDKLEAFAMSQFAKLESRLTQLDVLVQQAVETLNDAKSRQSTAAKTIGKLDKEGPLATLLKQSEVMSKVPDSQVSNEQIRSRVDDSMEQLRQRSTSRRRELVQSEIFDRSDVSSRIVRAQSVATTRRGRSLGRRIQAAQDLAADTERRIASEPSLLFPFISNTTESEVKSQTRKNP